MRRVFFSVMALVLVLGFSAVEGCGPSGPAAAAQQMLVASTAKDNKALLVISSQETKSYINSGFSKDIYGKNLPLDYVTSVLGTKGAHGAKIITKEEKGNDAVVQVTSAGKTFYLFFQKNNSNWRFDLPKTIILSRAATAKDRTIKAVASAEDVFTMSDYPSTVGLETRYFANKAYGPNYSPLPPAPIAFNLAGPWDFTSGPTDDEVVSTIVDKSQASDAANFPAANLVERTDVGETYDDGFFLNGPAGLNLPGESNHYMISKVPTIYTYAPGYDYLKYPLKKGLSWTDNFQTTESGFGAGAPSTSVRVNKVVAINQIKTPFKSYDRCFLVQSRKEEHWPNKTEVTYWYGWVVPQVGIVVEAKSVNGETNEVFTSAQRFWRLKYQGMEKAAGVPQK
jgi:hypothetical protein